MSLTTESSTNFWLTRPFSERSTQIFLGVLIAALALVTLLHVVVPADNPLHIGAYTVNLFGKYLSYALLAVAVDLVWGYLGILSLGHGAFFAIGGYAMGMYLMRQIGDRGTYGNPVLPDFMVFLNWDSLPWFWHGFDMAWFAFAMVLLAPGLLALVFGFLAFRSRVTGVYLSIITQALTFALMLAFFRNEMGFGGNNGLTDFREIVGFDLRSDATRLGLFLATGVALALGFILCRAIVTSKLGRVSVATRDAEARTRFLGYRVERFQLFVFVVSAMLAGLAGARLRAASGDYQPQRVLADFLHRDCAVGSPGRSRHAVWRGDWRHFGQLRQNHLYRRNARCLAVCARGNVRTGHGVSA